jgi:hypothetical protein
MTAGLAAFNVGMYRQCTHKIKLAQRSSWANEEISVGFRGLVCPATKAPSTIDSRWVRFCTTSCDRVHDHCV